jgi:hypothetical protein
MSITCVGMMLGLPRLQMIGWANIYRPRLKYSCWRKVVALYGTPDSPVVGTEQYSVLSGAP